VTEKFEFYFNGDLVSPDKFGPVYISDFIRILEIYATTGIRNILEWGSGLTTQVLAARLERMPNIELFVTIDTNRAYQNAIFAGRPKPACLREMILDPIGPHDQQAVSETTYSTYPLRLGRKFDFIFIDGRRRMECAFVASVVSHPETIVVIHDYRRARYQTILALFDVIEDGEEFRVLRPRREVLTAMQEGVARMEAALGPENRAWDATKN